MKIKYYFTLLFVILLMVVTDLYAQNDLVVVKNDGSQQSFALSQKPFMLFADDNIQINTQDNCVNVSYLEFNYFYYQGLQQNRMNVVVESSDGLSLHILDNDMMVLFRSAPKEIATNSYNTDLDDNGNSYYTKNCNIITTQLGEANPYYNRLPFNSYIDVTPTTESSQPYIAFNVPQIAAGTYDLYLVTIPLSFAEGVNEEDVAKGYQFRVNMFYRRYPEGWFPKSRNEVLKNPADSAGKETNFRSKPTEVDTIFLGTMTFDNTIANVRYPSLMVQIQSYVSTKEIQTYSRRMCFSGLIMKAHDEDFSTTKFVQFNDTTWYAPIELERISCLEKLIFSTEVVSDEIMSSQLSAKLDGSPYFADVDFYGMTLSPDENGIIRIPYILFPGYEYQYTPSLLVQGTPSTIRVKSDTGGLLATDVVMDETDAHISAKLLGMKTFCEQQIQKQSFQDYGFSSTTAPTYQVGIELRNTKTGKVFTYVEPQEIKTPSLSYLIENSGLTDKMEYTTSYKLYELGFNQTYQCRAFLQYGTNIPMLDTSSAEEFRCYDSNAVLFTTPTRASYENQLKPKYLPQIMASDASISLFNQAMAVTHMGDLLEKYIDEEYSLSSDSVDQWFPQATGEECDMVGYMRTRYLGYTGFIESDAVFAQYEIATLEDLRKYAKQVYDEMYPEDANVSDETDKRNSLNRFVAYHFLPARIDYNMLTADNALLYAFDRNHWDVAEWYETMMPYSIMKVSYPDGANAGRYVNRRGLKDGPDWRGVFVAGAKIFPPQEETQTGLNAINGVYYYVDHIIDYGRNTQEVVLNERMRIDATTLSPDFLTSGARGHAVLGTGAWPQYPGLYGVNNTSRDPNVNPNHCLGFKAGAATNFIFNDGQTHLHVRNRYLSNWSYEGDELTIAGKFDVTVKIPPVPAGDYELRVQACLGFADRGIIMYYLDGKPCGLPKDLRISTYNLPIGYKSDSDLGNTEAIIANDRAMHNHGWMKGPASYGNISVNTANSPNWMRDNKLTLRHVVTTFHSDGKTNHYLRMQQLLDAYNTVFPFDFIELCPRSIYDNELYIEDKW